MHPGRGGWGVRTGRMPGVTTRQYGLRQGVATQQMVRYGGFQALPGVHDRL